MAKETTPNRLALCIMLAGGNHMAGVLLERIMHWRPYGNAVIPDVEGKWIANDRRWWMQEARLSADQYDRAIARLKKLGLIEARQWWWGKRNILNVRPSSKTLDYIAAAKTWQAAYEFIGGNDQIEKLSSSAEPGSAVPLNSNGFSNSAEPSAAQMLISNNMENIHAYFVSEEKNSTCAHPASPSCATSAPVHGEAFGKEKNNIPVSSKDATPPSMHGSSSGAVQLPTVKHLIDVWRAAMMKHHGHAVSQKLTSCEPSAKGKGIIAQFLAGLEFVTKSKPDGVYEYDYRPFAAHILAYGVRRWSTFSGPYGKLPAYPDVKNVCEDLLGEVINAWIAEDCPTHELDMFLQSQHTGP